MMSVIHETFASSTVRGKLIQHVSAKAQKNGSFFLTVHSKTSFKVLPTAFKNALKDVSLLMSPHLSEPLGSDLLTPMPPPPDRSLRADGQVHLGGFH